jgi:hypothetical protein
VKTKTLEQLETILVEKSIIFSTIRHDVMGVWTVTLGGAFSTVEPLKGHGRTLAEALGNALGEGGDDDGN